MVKAAALSTPNPQQQLNELIKAETPPQILLLCADDNIRKQRALAQLKAKYFPNSTVSVNKIDAASWNKDTAKNIINLLSSPGLFSSVILVEVCSVELLKVEQLDQLLSCLPYASEQTSLWLTGTSLAKGNKLRKAIEKQATVIDFPNLSGSSLKAWIKKEATNNDLPDLNEQIISAIIQLTDSSLDQSVAIIEHIALYSNEGKLTYADFIKLYPDAPEESEFALLDLIHFGKSSAVAAKITKFFQEGKNSFMFLGLLVRTYSKYIAMRSMLERGIAQMQIRESLAMKEWTYKKYMEIVSKKNTKRLYCDLEALLKADSKLKNKSLGETEIFCELAQSLAVNFQLKSSENLH